MTIEPRHVELMNAVIDRVASEEEKSALRELLASDPVARQQFEQLRKLSETLAGVGEVEPPAAMKADIVRALRTSPTREPLPFLRRMGDLWPGRRVVLRYGYAVAAGLVLGIALMRWVPDSADAPRALDPSELVGTMVPRAGASAAGILQQVPVGFEGGSGTATLRRVEAGYAIELDLDSLEPVEVALGFDPGKALLRGFAQDPDTVSDLRAGAGRIVWTQSGHRRLAVLVCPRTPAETAVALELTSGGKSLQISALRIPGEGS